MQPPGRADSQKAVVARNPLLGASEIPAGPKDMIGLVLGAKYRLLEHLGSGGMAHVFLAEQIELSKRVAVKVMVERIAADDVARERFIREAKAASQIDHENVVSVLDYGETPNGNAFLVMELLKGEPLSETLKREGPFSNHRAKMVGLQVCRALHAAHDKGVLHRDVKPENCFRSKRGANPDFIKVIDFGLAKLVGDENRPEQSLTESGTIFGTPEYMSPEQCRGRRVDARTDVYAMGVMLYEMVTGRLPFTAPTFIQVLTMHAMQAPVPPSEVEGGPTVNSAMEALILSALEKDPTDRFQSMREMAEALASLPGPTQAAIPRPALPEPPRRARASEDSRKSSQRLTLIIAAQFLVIAVLLALLLLR